MAKPKKIAEKTGPMFREGMDINGVEISCNSHSAADYEPRYPRQTSEYSLRTDGTGTVTGMDEGIAGGVRRQVLSQICQRNGTMSFRSLIGREKR